MSMDEQRVCAMSPVLTFCIDRVARPFQSSPSYTHPEEDDDGRQQSAQI
jgi:hypothetical protein